jgi:hypothetical protein
VNDAEAIKTVTGPNGKKGTFVIPPTWAKGFVPNFAMQMSADGKSVKSKGGRLPKRDFEVDAGLLGIGAIVGVGENGLRTTSTSIGKITSPNAKELRSKFNEDSKLQINNLPVSAIPGKFKK